MGGVACFISTVGGIVCFFSKVGVVSTAAVAVGIGADGIDAADTSIFDSFVGLMTVSGCVRLDTSGCLHTL